jgi:hypothetical protein
MEFQGIKWVAWTSSLGYDIVCTLVPNNTCSLLNLFALWVCLKIRVALV